ncbi:MAG TPA: type VI secretion system-associated FHA domain protein TagH [Syntrophobacteraceae bacterium]|nr:type VI secretion system-associated FHA domain protein TagH [Syntrophobacteraceae bacterium]
MPIRIDILKYQGQPTPRRSSVIIDKGGGTIGRATDNSVVLHDETASRRHARISFEEGRYYLRDESANGTLIHNRDLFIHHEKVQLIDGDILQIGDHELRVNITPEEDALPRRHTPVAPPIGNSVSGPSGKEEIREYPYARTRADAAKGPAKELSIDDFFKDTDEFFKDAGEIPLSGPAPGHSEVEEEEAKVHEASYPAYRSEAELPAGDTDGERKPASIIPKIPEQGGQAREEVYRELWNRFLKAAGLENASYSDAEIPDLLEGLGGVFRELVNGLWMALRGRAQMKAEIRIAMTMVRPTSNNPVKFAPTVEDAVKHLLKRDHPSFLKPIDAVRESYGDLMNHQLALDAGIQAALVDAFDRFDPERFSEKNKDGSLLHTRGKIWKAYCEAYPELKEEALEGIFGKAFIRAYEEQLERLRLKKTAT